MPERWPIRRRSRFRRLASVAVVLAVIATAWVLIAPPGLPRNLPSARPAPSYDEALRRTEVLRSRDTEAIASVCRLRLMTHGHPTPRAFVLLHGLSNCPQQFDALGTMLFERGANVLIARFPHHGLADRMTEDMRHLTATEVVAFGDEVVDIARGLGDSVTVAGLSLGANAAAWIAQQREDVDRVVVIAPVFGLHQVWPPFTSAMTKLFLTLPNQFPWWDSKRRADLLGPPYVYPRFSTRALGEILRLGLAVGGHARRRAPRAASILVVTVGDDPAISNEAALAVARAWQKRAGDRVETYEFPRELELGHDLVDPLQPNQKTDLVYPIMVELLTR
jgi:carboxylesterase